MQIGCSAPTSGPLTAPDSLTRIAAEAEALGYDYVTVSDQLVIPTDIESRYPYSSSGEFPVGARVERLELLTAATWIAAKTSTLRIVTSVMVVPHRPAVLTAKILATIDTLSAGRLTLGIGAGWLREEFTALGAPPFDERGVVTDESILACKELWTSDAPRFDGRYTSFGNILFAPKPVQQPIPIWVGGESGPALRRAAKLGDAWYPIGTNPQFPLDTLPRYKARITDLRAAVEKAGRNPDSVALVYRVSSSPGVQPTDSVDGERRLFTGGHADFLGDLRALRDLGVASVDLGLTGPSLESTLDAMRRFREEVAARL
jgi:probable F420-dependent oxidoreductase